MKCQHCYANIFNARTDADGLKHWIPWGKDPKLFTIEDQCCTIDRGVSIFHAPMPNIKGANANG